MGYFHCFLKKQLQHVHFKFKSGALCAQCGLIGGGNLQQQTVYFTNMSEPIQWFPVRILDHFYHLNIQRSKWFHLPVLSFNPGKEISLNLFTITYIFSDYFFPLTNLLWETIVTHYFLIQYKRSSSLALLFRDFCQVSFYIQYTVLAHEITLRKVRSGHPTVTLHNIFQSSFSYNHFFFF